LRYPLPGIIYLDMDQSALGGDRRMSSLRGSESLAGTFEIGLSALRPTAPGLDAATVGERDLQRRMTRDHGPHKSVRGLVRACDGVCECSTADLFWTALDTSHVPHRGPRLHALRFSDCSHVDRPVTACNNRLAHRHVVGCGPLRPSPTLQNFQVHLAEPIAIVTVYMP
jgi:hypothetical protein